MFCVRPKSVWCDAYPTTGMYKTYACSVMRMKFNVHDMMRNESYIRTQRTSTSKLLYAPCSYKHWAATASLLLGIFSGLFLVSSQGPFAPFRCLDWKPRVPLQCNLGNLENIYNVTWGTLRTFTWNPWEAWEPVSYTHLTLPTKRIV